MASHGSFCRMPINKYLYFIRFLKSTIVSAIFGTVFKKCNSNFRGKRIVLRGCGIRLWREKQKCRDSIGREVLGMWAKCSPVCWAAPIVDTSVEACRIYIKVFVLTVDKINNLLCYLKTSLEQYKLDKTITTLHW